MASGGRDLANDLPSEDLLTDRNDRVDRLVGRAQAAVIDAHDAPTRQITCIDDTARAGCEDPGLGGGSQIYPTVSRVPICRARGEWGQDSKRPVNGRSPSGCFGRGRHEEGQESDYGDEDESGAAHLGRLPGRGSRDKVPERPCGWSTVPRPVHSSLDQMASAGRLHRTTFAGSGPPDTFQRSRV